MGKCRDALREEGGDMEKAVEWLRRRGIRSMEKRAEGSEALLALSVEEGVGGAIVELRAETDFVTRGDIFQHLGLVLARTAAGLGAGGAELMETTLAETTSLPLTSAGATAERALLEVGSVVGERLTVGKYQRLAAPAGGILAGYAHPKQADGLPGTGRLAALVALRPSPAGVGDASQLQAMASRLARHIVAAQPRFTSVSSIPLEVLEKEQATIKAAHLAQMGSEKAAKVSEKNLTKAIEGKTRKFYQESVLLSQELLVPRDGAAQEEAAPITVESWLQSEAAALGLDSIEVDSFQLACL